MTKAETNHGKHYSSIQDYAEILDSAIQKATPKNSNADPHSFDCLPTSV